MTDGTKKNNSARVGTAAAVAVFCLFLAVFYYLPVLLIWLGIIEFEYRFRVLIILALLLAVYSFIRGHSLFALGLRADNLKNSFLLNAVWSFVLLAFLLTAFFAGAIRRPSVPDWEWFFLFYIFVSAPAQEFIFRSVLFAELDKAGIRSAFWQISATSLTYCFLHIIYNDWLTLAVTFAMGVVWGIIYYKNPNFWGVAFSHAVLGAVSILVGLV